MKRDAISFVAARASRAQLRRAFHGPILREISEQARVDTDVPGRTVRYAKAAWKILFAQQFLEPQFDASGAEIDPPSTAAISDDEFRTFLHEVCAFACNDLKVTFPERVR